MLDSLFGAQLGTTAKFVIAFLLVLGLIGVTALILKRFGSGRMPLSGGGRNRQPRLAVLDSAAIDAKRQLVLIRRDNAEHLLLIGGPTDIVVETNIVRTGPQAAAAAERRPQLRGASESETSEYSLVPEPLYDEPAPRAPEPAPRLRERESAQRSQPEPEVAPRLREPAPAPRPRSEEPASYTPPPPPPAPRPAAQPSAPAPTAPAAASPAPRPVAHPSAATPATPSPALQSSYDDMAQRLEAALRKPAPAPAPKAPEPQAQAAPQPRPTPPMPQTRPMPAAPAPATAQPSAPKPSRQETPNPFDSLEAEMASLLGQDRKEKR